MQIDILREFVLLSKSLNFTNTAEQCHITQSVLSRHISALEKELDAELFIRNRRRVRLTKMGELFARDMEKVLEEYDASLERLNLLKENRTGILRIGYLAGAVHSFIAAVYSRFIARYPHIGVELCCAEGEQLMRSLDSNDFDIIITMVFGKLNHDWYSSIKIFDDRYEAIIPDDHPLAAKESLELDDLAGQQIIIPNQKRFRDQYEYLKHAFGKIPGVTLDARINDMNDIPVLALAERSVSIAPSHLFYSLGTTGIRRVAINTHELCFDVEAIWKTSKESPSILSFIDELRGFTESMSTEELRNYF